MGWSQILFGCALVALLLVVAVFYAWRQFQALRALRVPPGPPPEEASYERGKARRRLASSALLFVLGILLGGALLFLEEPAERLGDEIKAARDEARARGAEPPAYTPAQRDLARLYGVYWIVILLILLAVVTLAAIDLWAIRRFGLEQRRRINADRRAMIERQIERLRADRNGHG